MTAKIVTVLFALGAALVGVDAFLAFVIGPFREPGPIAICGLFAAGAAGAAVVVSTAFEAWK